MILHANAALSRRQRERLVALVFAGATITAAALVVGCSRQTASKWIGRARRGESLATAPHARAARPDARRRRSSKRCCELATSCGSARTARLGARARRLDRARDPAPARLLAAEAASAARAGRPLRARAAGRAAARRRQVAGPDRRPRPPRDRRPPRSRGAGWLYVFAAIDDASRLGFAQIYPDENADSALAFLEPASASTPGTGSVSSAC